MATLSSNSIDDLSLAEVPINIIDKRSKMFKTLDNIYLSADPYVKVRSFTYKIGVMKFIVKNILRIKITIWMLEFEKLLD